MQWGRVTPVLSRDSRAQCVGKSGLAWRRGLGCPAAGEGWPCRVCPPESSNQALFLRQAPAGPGVPQFLWLGPASDAASSNSMGVLIRIAGVWGGVVVQGVQPLASVSIQSCWLLAGCEAVCPVSWHLWTRVRHGLPWSARKNTVCAVPGEKGAGRLNCRRRPLRKFRARRGKVCSGSEFVILCLCVMIILYVACKSHKHLGP